jgi:hypothetical protein
MGHLFFYSISSRRYQGRKYNVSALHEKRFKYVRISFQRRKRFLALDQLSFFELDPAAQFPKVRFVNVFLSAIAALLVK